MNINEIFMEEFGGEMNALTPTLVRRQMKGENRAVELSCGKGIVSKTLYGVTVVDVTPDGETKRNYDLSTCYSTRAEAERAIREIPERRGDEDCGRETSGEDCSGQPQNESRRNGRP